MPNVSHRGSGSRRRTISEINMVPFIDVMLVLLIIFMVTAPLITTGVVDLPSVGKSSKRPDHVVELVVGSDDKVKLRIDGKDGAAVAMRDVAAKVKDGQKTASPGPTSQAISGRAMASVPLAQDRASLAWPNSASLASNSRTCGPMT